MTTVKRFYKQLVGLFFLFICQTVFSQAPDAYIVTFTDKDNSTYEVAFPEAFLSPKAIEKRTRLNIPITEEDLPINPSYIDALNAFSSIHIIAQSKWMNYVVITCSNQLLLNTLPYLPFVDQVEKIYHVDYSRFSVQFSDRNFNFSNQIVSEPDTNGLDYYGKAAGQMRVHNGNYLHQNGFRGDNMLIVMLDNGFNSLDTLNYFLGFRNSIHFLGTYDAASQNNYNIYRSGSHGTLVLSVMALNEPYTFVGTAPNADYFLVRTEMDGYEDLLEEYFWVEGAEFADSLGADVVNSSLGYSRFDSVYQNHTFYDLDGKHSVASIAASKLAQKGCIVCVAAGNEGEKPWHFISIPSDAPDVLCVAAMNTDSVIADFSSRGDPSFLYVKPDITSVGWQTAYCSIADTLSNGNGTSLATPVTAGLSACLWQAFPNKSSLEIMEAIRQSAHLYNQSDSLFGYGIPDFKKAYQMLLESSVNEMENNLDIKLFPNPAHDYMDIQFASEITSLYHVEITDVSGKVLMHKSFNIQNVRLNISTFAKGIYFLTLSLPNRCTKTLKFIIN